MIGRLLWLADVLNDEGLGVVEDPGWTTRGADKLLSRMDPQIVLAHHTATGTNWTDAAVANLLVKGRADLPGPLAHLGLQRDGVYIIIASGVANHGGAGSWKNITGNKRCIGIEAYNNGLGEPWPPVQMDAYDRGSAALLRQIGKDASFLAGHKEYATPPGRKIDPYGIDMQTMRTRIAIILEDQMTVTQARLELAAAWHARSGVWMTPQFPESAQARLTRLALEVASKVRSVAEIVQYAPIGQAQDGPIPAWVIDPSIPTV
jgi:N-acetylmuramoyl-L-alanine amidase-like protein